MHHLAAVDADGLPRDVPLRDTKPSHRTLGESANVHPGLLLSASPLPHSSEEWRSEGASRSWPARQTDWFDTTSVIFMDDWQREPRGAIGPQSSKNLRGLPSNLTPLQGAIHCHPMATPWENRPQKRVRPERAPEPARSISKRAPSWAASGVLLVGAERICGLPVDSHSPPGFGGLGSVYA